MNVMLIFIVLLPILFILAMISRKHFSKYKGEGWLMPQISGRLQKIEVLYGRQLEDAAQVYMEQKFRRLLIALVVFWVAAVGIYFLPAADPSAGPVTRPSAGDGAKEVDLTLTDGSGEKTYTLKIEPKVMSEEEFHAAVLEAEEYLKKVIPGENRDLNEVTKDIKLPTKDGTGKLSIRWSTDDPSVVNKSGKVFRDGLEDPVTVTIRAKLSDGDHTETYEEKVTVLPVSATESAIDAAIRAIRRMEETGRADDTLDLPEEMGEVKISTKKEDTKEMICKLYFLLIILGIVIFFIRQNREKEKVKERNIRLSRVFYRFVRRMSLLLSAGETLQGALAGAAGVDERYLLPEVTYTLNRIRTGKAEQQAYADLGRSLGLSNYIRLFTTISTAGPRGSSQLLNLLDQEVHDAESEARDNARKKGEQAQEKLLFPMVILMATVIGIVLYPAVAGM